MQLKNGLSESNFITESLNKTIKLLEAEKQVLIPQYGAISAHHQDRLSSNENTFLRVHVLLQKNDKILK